MFPLPRFVPLPHLGRFGHVSFASFCFLCHIWKGLFLFPVPHFERFLHVSFPSFCFLCHILKVIHVSFASFCFLCLILEGLALQTFKT